MPERVFYCALEQRLLLDAAMIASGDDIQQNSEADLDAGNNGAEEKVDVDGLLLAFTEIIGEDCEPELVLASPRDEKAPVAFSASFSMLENEILQANVVAVDEDDSLTFSLIEDVSHGHLALASNGEFTYTALPDLNKLDAGQQAITTFIFAAEDSAGHLSHPATITITITRLDTTVVPMVDISVGDTQRKQPSERETIRPEIHLDFSLLNPDYLSASYLGNEEVALTLVNIRNIAADCLPQLESSSDEATSNDRDQPLCPERDESSEARDVKPTGHQSPYVGMLPSRESVAFDMQFHEKLDKAVTDSDLRSKSRTFIQDVMTLPFKRV